MSLENLSAWQHDHRFNDAKHLAERNTRRVMWLTVVAMVVEIAAGWWFNSMALLADGWHMSSHALAIGLTAVAYASARRYEQDPRFAFGTWKIEILAGFASAIFLLGVAALMVAGSLERLVAPQPIRYQEAIIVAVLGLAVNLVSARLLGQSHDHGHGHGHGHHHDHAHDHAHGHEDLNLRSAYLHVIADAATSALAIVALLGGWLMDWAWLDPVMGIVGAALVAVWAKGLIVQTGTVLLDREMDHPVVAEIREAVEAGPGAGDTRLADLHVWRVGQRSYACALTVVTRDPTVSPDSLRTRLVVHEEIVHSTIEVHRVDEGRAPPG